MFSIWSRIRFQVGHLITPIPNKKNNESYVIWDVYANGNLAARPENKKSSAAGIKTRQPWMATKVQGSMHASLCCIPKQRRVK